MIIERHFEGSRKSGARWLSILCGQIWGITERLFSRVFRQPDFVKKKAHSCRLLVYCLIVTLLDILDIIYGTSVISNQPVAGFIKVIHVLKQYSLIFIHLCLRPESHLCKSMTDVRI